MKTVKSILFFAAFFLSNCVNADAYKCMKGGRPVYQGTPCEINSDKGKLDIKEQTPEQKAMALEKLEGIRKEYDASAMKQKEVMSTTIDAQNRPVDAPQQPADVGDQTVNTGNTNENAGDNEAKD